jgi:hypothetical protein
LAGEVEIAGPTALAEAGTGSGAEASRPGQRRRTRASWLLIGAAVCLCLGASSALLMLYGPTPTLPFVRSWEGDLMKSVVSPDKQWRARSYYLNPGAMATANMRVAVGRVGEPLREARNIYDGTPGAIRWMANGDLSIDGHVVDVEEAPTVTIGPDPWTPDMALFLVMRLGYALFPGLCLVAAVFFLVHVVRRRRGRAPLQAT